MGKKRERESWAKLRRNSRILAGLEANFVWVAVFGGGRAASGGWASGLFAASNQCFCFAQTHWRTSTIFGALNIVASI